MISTPFPTQQAVDGSPPKFQYASDLIDVSMETLTGTMSRMIRTMNTARQGNKQAQEAFDQLGIAITDANGQLRDGETVFNETIKALGNIANETERDAIAMQIFGRSARDLNPLIKGGADRLRSGEGEGRWPHHV